MVGGKSTETLLIRVAFHARYEDFATFLEGLNALRRLATLEDMRMGRTVPEMSVQMTLRTYFFKVK
jgi:Tfp pilus assembly protein PilO